MPTARRIRLNPCDTLYLAHHRMLQRTGRGGNIAFLVMDVAGHLDPETVRHALAAAMVRYPATMAGLRISPLSGRPFWKTPDDLPLAAHRAAAEAHVYDDLRTTNDWRARLEQLCQNRYTAGWDLRRGPQVGLEHYALPDDRTRLRLRWPHLFMDAEGAQWFLAALSQPQQDDSHARRPQAAPLPSAPGACPRTVAPASRRCLITGRRPVPQEVSGQVLIPDDQPRDVLSGHSLRERIGLLRRGLAGQQVCRGLRIRPLMPAQTRRFSGYRVLYRHFSAEQVERMKAKAKAVTPPGPALYSRYLAASVIRALHRLYTERDVETEAYLITFPMRVGIPDESAGVLRKRPLPGNYLIAPTLCGRREHAHDKHALGEDLQRQIQDYHRNRLDLGQWAMLWAASFIHAWFYHWIFRLPLGLGDFASGYSYLGEIDRPIRSICGAAVTNLCAGGPINTPPGWNPVFSRFRDRLNLAFTWNHPAVPDDLVHRYVALIEAEAFETP